MIPLRRIERISGFSVATATDSYVYRPSTSDEIIDAIEVARASGRKVALRGAGLSYGDAAVLSEGVVLDLSRMNRILNWNPSDGVIEVEPGVTLEQVWRKTLSDGYWPPVFSGTMKATVGGAVAMNIHGKDHFATGSFAEHVTYLDLLACDGATRRVTPEDPVFWAIGGGLGLLGIVIRIGVRLRKVPSGDMLVFTRRASSVRSHLDAFEEFQSTSAGVISWLDCHRGGRGIFEAGVCAESDAGSQTESHQDWPPKRAGIPREDAWKLLKFAVGNFGIRALNAARYASAKRLDGKSRLMPLTTFTYQLDAFPNWQHALLPGGLLQLQSFVPVEVAADVFDSQLQRQRAEGLVSYLAVIKRHRKDRTVLPYAVDGYSLATDFRVTATNESRLRSMIRSMSNDVLAAGGRFYFAKDGTLDSAQAHRFLGREALDRFATWKRELDPTGLLDSNLARRLSLLNPME